MKIHIAAVGRADKKSPEHTLWARYQERLSKIGWSLDLKEILPKTPQVEGKALLQAVESCEFVVLLDERGEALSSPDFANHLEKLQLRGVSKVGCLIGGADGVEESVRTRADLILSFGKATWPHMLVRAMIAEQLYRACQILKNHPYHHG